MTAFLPPRRLMGPAVETALAAPNAAGAFLLGYVMRTAFANPRVVESEIQGQFLPERDKIVTPPNWVAHARLAWPNKTAATIAAIAKRDERTAKRWLAGEFEPPLAVAAALIQEIFS